MLQEADIKSLPKYQKRAFVPENIDLSDVDQIKALYDQLQNREVDSVDALEQWVLQRSELEAALSQEGTIIYILMTCSTDDKIRVENYKRFVETIQPAVKPLNDALNKKYLKELKRFPLDESRYSVYTREVQSDVELFRQENVSLYTKEELLSQEYQSTCGEMTVEFNGKEHTLQQMGKYLLEPDRKLREQAWRLISQRRLKDKQKLDDLFDEMLKVRNQIAKNSDCQNYIEYKFKSLCRFDYTPKDCKQYHVAVEKSVVPLWTKILDWRKNVMGLESLKPWDTAVDPQGKEPLKPFESVEELTNGCKKIFNNIDDELGKQFSEIAEHGLLDLDSRKGKAPGGYHNTLNEARNSFIFMNAVGIESDLRTLLHEAGHAFHSQACRHDPLIDYRHGPMEFNEVASMAMELLAGDYLSVFYKEEEHHRSVVDHLMDVVYTLVWVAVVDCFQHWIYENKNHNQKERYDAWLSIHERFLGEGVDWSGFEMERGYAWHRQLHIFEVPFYYIEYGIAQLGALQMWQNARRDWKKALSDYKRGLSLGGSKPLPQLYEAAGIQFDFKEETIAPLMEAISDELSEKIANF